MNTTLNYVRLPLENLKNGRDLGGYPTELGNQTKWHRYIRASDMSALTETEMQQLEDYGLKTVIDLRSDQELAKQPNPFAKSDSVKYVHVNLAEMDDVSRTFLTKDLEKFSLGEFYLQMLKRGSGIAKVFQEFAKLPEGAALFHCSAGKDRTGVIAMLLLALAGVKRKDILTNYMVSFTNLEYDALDDSIPMNLMDSNPKEIALAYDTLQEHYPSIDDYFESIGLSKKEIEAIREEFLA